MQVLEFGVDICPYGHDWHIDSPELEYFPAVHITHDDEPSNETEPAWHFMHRVDAL
jgi:hypothetical protein